MIKRFFHDANVKRLYFHSVLFNIADKITLIFGPVFLLQSGYSVVETLLIWAAFYFVRFIIRWVYLFCFPYLKLKGSLVLGAVIAATSLLVLFLARKPEYLPLYILLFAVGDAFYWTAYNTLFGFYGEPQHKGKYYAMMSSISMLAAAFAPVLSAWVVTSAGYVWLFTLTAFLTLSSTLPVLSLPNLKERFSSFRESRKDKMNHWVFGLHFFSSLHVVGPNIIWPIAVFLVIGNIMEYGMIITAGILVLAVVHLVVGSQVDKGKGYALFKWGALVHWAQSLLRIFASTPAAIVASESLTVGRHLMTQLDADFYNGSKVARNHLWYFYYAEGGWDAGAALLMLSVAGLYALGVPLPVSLALAAVPGLTGCAFLVLRSKIGKQLARGNP